MSATKLIATQVPNAQRLNMLPALFGLRCVHFEHAVFNMANELLPEYRGAYWEFFRIDNGGFYMVPQIQGKSARGMEHLVRVQVEGNFFDEEMSREAAGIVCCLMTYSQESFNSSGRYQEVLADQFHLLRDFACEHPEAELIFAAID